MRVCMNFTDENNQHLHNDTSTEKLSVSEEQLTQLPQQNNVYNIPVSQPTAQPTVQNYPPNVPPQPIRQNYPPNVPPQPIRQNYPPNIPPQPIRQNYSPNIPPQPIRQNYSPNIPPQPMGQNYPPNVPPQPMGQNYPPNFDSNPYVQQNSVTSQPDVFEQNQPQFDPNLTYYPYYNGTPIPYGATTHYINGRWYYAFKGADPKRKMALSVKVLLTIIIAMAIALTVALFWWSSSTSTSTKNQKGFNWEDFYKNYQLPNNNNDNDNNSSDVIGKYADPEGPEISLENLDTSTGSTEKAYEKLSVSVVSVSVYKQGETPQENLPSSEGTGIIISQDGYIVTNSHVINDDVQSNVYITTKDDDVFSVVVVGNDTRTDIAVLKCETDDNFSPAIFTSSDNLKVGQDVVAIGSPGGSGYSSSITKGIVSALDRTLSGNANTYIQTDTAINPGNSGGPLATLNGQVVGINTIKIVDTQYEGMGFAIPSVTVKNIADSLIKYGMVKDRPQLGIIGREISEIQAKSQNTVSGIEIMQIDDDSPIKNTKIKVGDVITKIDGIEVHSFYELFATLDNYSIGDSIALSVCRTDKNNRDQKEYFTVTIALIGD